MTFPTGVSDRPGEANDPKGAPKPSIGSLDLLKGAAEASLVFGALLFVIGWSYLDAYYGAFGLKVGQLGISTQEVIISSLNFIFENVVSISLFSIGIVAAVTLIGYFSEVKGLRREFLVGFMLVGLLAVSGIVANQASTLGREIALRDTLTKTTKLPWVEVEVDETKVGKHIVDPHELENKAYHLLLQTDSKVWLFKSVEDTNGDFTVVNLPKEAIRVIRAERPKGGIR